MAQDLLGVSIDFPDLGEGHFQFTPHYHIILKDSYASTRMCEFHREHFLQPRDKIQKNKTKKLVFPKLLCEVSLYKQNT